MGEIFNDGGLPHGAFTAELSNGKFYDFERFRPRKASKTINQYGPDGSPKKSVDVRDFDMATATIQVDTQVAGVPQDMPQQGVTMSLDRGYGPETWRLQSIDGPGFDMGDYWRFETTWQRNVN